MAIYITQGLWLSGGLSAGGFNPNSPRIGYQNLLESGSIIADFELSDYPATNIQNPSTGEYWVSSNSVDTQYLTMQITPAKVNYFAIAGQDLDGATLKLQRRDDPGDAWSDVVLPVITANNEAIMWLFESVVTSAFWRLEIIPNSSVPPRIAVIYIGEYLTLQRNRYVGHTPSNYAVNSYTTTNMNEKGSYMGCVVTSQDQDFMIDQDNVSPSFYRSYVEPLRKHYITRPIFALGGLRSILMK